jgi:hypothetical protein
VKFIKIITALFFTTLASSAIATEGYSGAPSSDKLYVATTGDVILTFLFKEAAFSNDLFLEGNNSVILNNQTAVPNITQINLGSFAANSLLTFKMTVSNTGFSFFTGDSSLNPDGFNHALFDKEAGKPLIVGFEDILGGGDKDYNDLVFSLTNVYAATGPTPVPEPESFAMLAAGLLLLRLRKNRKV